MIVETGGEFYFHGEKTSKKGFTFFAAGIPLTPELRITVGYDVGVTGAARFGFIREGTTTITLKKEVGSMKYIPEFSKNMEIIPVNPEFNVSGEVTAYLRPGLYLLLGHSKLASAGVFADVEGYITAATPPLTIVAGIEPHVGLTASLWNLEGNVRTPLNRFAYEKILYPDPGPVLPVAPSELKANAFPTQGNRIKIS